MGLFDFRFRNNQPIAPPLDHSKIAAMLARSRGNENLFISTVIDVRNHARQGGHKGVGALMDYALRQRLAYSTTRSLTSAGRELRDQVLTLELLRVLASSPYSFVSGDQTARAWPELLLLAGQSAIAERRQVRGPLSKTPAATRPPELRLSHASPPIVWNAVPSRILHAMATSPTSLKLGGRSGYASLLWPDGDTVAEPAIRVWLRGRLMLRPPIDVVMGIQEFQAVADVVLAMWALELRDEFRREPLRAQYASGLFDMLVGVEQSHAICSKLARTVAGSFASHLPKDGGLTALLAALDLATFGVPVRQTGLLSPGTLAEVQAIAGMGWTPDRVTGVVTGHAGDAENPKLAVQLTGWHGPDEHDLYPATSVRELLPPRFAAS